LISSEGGQGNRPELDNFVVERIIGQYMMSGDESVAASHFVHHRVYVADADSTGISLRNLAVGDDAETSFLWHRVEPWAIEYNGDLWGNWEKGGAATPPATAWQGRHGNVDIRVGRRISGGSDLIWHTQLVPAPAANLTMYLKLWLRMLVREV
jgi:hypothetical protein